MMANTQLFDKALTSIKTVTIKPNLASKAAE